MALLFIAPDRNPDPWKEAFDKVDSNLDLFFWPAIDQHKKINFIVCWNHPARLLDRFPNLQAVASLGAGVDHILADECLPDHVQICRTLTPRLIQEMVDYVRTSLLMHQRNITFYLQQKRQARWKHRKNRIASDLEVGVMGLGTIGRKVALELGNEGYNVRGWSRSSKQIKKVSTFAGNKEKASFLEGLDALICLLPLTSETRGILDLEVFKQLKNDAILINIARGSHLVEEDLVYALDKGLLEWAMLDVFQKEPLPDHHSFWNRPEIVITPHIAGITPPEEAAEVIIENYKRAISGMDLKYTVQRDKGY